MFNQSKMNEQQLGLYLRKLNISANLSNDLDTLKKLQYHHLSHIPYENLDSLNGKITSLSHEDLFHKLIETPRGGICFELNGLYNWLLESLGYKVISYAARIITKEEEYQMRRHRVICTEINGQHYLTDVGVNMESPRTPLLLEKDIVQTDDISEYKFTIHPFWGWLLWQKEIGKDWKRIYGFTEEPQLDIDFVMPTIFCDVHPLSPINKIKKISILTPDMNIMIRGNLLKFYSSGKVIKRIEITNEEELKTILWNYFGIIADFTM